MSDILQLRNEDTLSKEKIKGIKVITIPNQDYIYYGSYIYAAQPYPNDIDLIQNIQLCKDGCNRDFASLKAKKMIQQLIKKINNSKDTYLGDVKLGGDFKIFEYMLNNKTWFNYNDFDVKQGKVDIKNIYQEQLITKTSYDEIMKKFKILENKKEKSIFYELSELLRNLIILRWTGKELPGIRRDQQRWQRQQPRRRPRAYARIRQWFCCRFRLFLESISRR
jgi:hypothetical protein